MDSYNEVEVSFQPRLFRGWAMTGVAAAPCITGWVMANGLASVQGTLSFDKDALPFLTAHCLPCHQGAEAPQGVRFDIVRTRDEAASRRSLWARVQSVLESGAMPPSGLVRPPAADLQRMKEWLRAALKSLPEDTPDPGRVTLRRLNRAEYNNTIRDLFGIDLRPADDFPSDDVGYGFENIGDVLSTSPLLLERYLGAAQKVAETVIELREPVALRVEAGDLPPGGGQRVLPSGEVLLTTNGEVGSFVRVPASGSYRIRASAWGQQAGPEPCRMTLSVDGKVVQAFRVTATRGNETVYEAPVQVEAGRRQIAAAFINDYYNPGHEDPAQRDRNLAIRYVELYGPLASTQPPSQAHRWLVPRTPSKSEAPAEARAALGRLMERAFRRPVSAQEVERIARLVDQALSEGDSYEAALRLGVQAVLVSPHFLFRVEPDPPGFRSGSIRKLGAYEVASRLSYFLWSSMPDEELFDLAKKDQLADPTVLRAQVKRMLEDPKAEALSDEFAVQWLTLRRLDISSPDPTLAPEWNEELLASIREEPKRLFQYVLRERRPIREFLSANYVFLDANLAKLYGLENEYRRAGGTLDGKGGFVRTTIGSSQRGGLLTTAAVLTVTSNPNRTSPVKRGKWVLETILAEAPPPPPPGLAPLEGDLDTVPSENIKARLERHRRDPACAVCHVKMDPIGFSFENYDLIGRWRTQDGPFPVDASGDLPSGEKLRGISGLKNLLLKEEDKFVHALAQQVLTYALGRGATDKDRPYLQRIVRETRNGGGTLEAMIAALVTSEPFLTKRVER